MSSDDWLTQLAPPHAPPPPGWWPPAPGWWGIAIIICLGIAVWIYRWRNPKYRIRHAALRELKELEKTIQDDILLASKLEYLFRHYALKRFERQQVAQLTGKAWLDFIIAHGGTAFSGEIGNHLLIAAYRGQGLTHRQEWLKGAYGFLKGCP